MARPASGTIIVKKIRKGGAHQHHSSGAWKVAYADFVTAMMAFFLLLWLLNVTTDTQKRGIADYFEPSVAVRPAPSGAGGLLGGKVLGKPGSMTVSAAAPAILVPMPALRQPDEGNEGEESGSPLATLPSDDERYADKDDHLDRQLAEREEKRFAAAEFALRQAIQDVPELKDLAENLIIDRTPEGLRIQLVDQDKASMFPLGSAEMAEPARKLMALVVQAVQKLPNKISLTGHTDATPYAGNRNYGNWELSTDRANASRRELLHAGLAAERIAKVVGMADRDPLFPKEPLSPRNRRISIVLLREAPLPADPSTAAAPAPSVTAPKRLAQR